MAKFLKKNDELTGDVIVFLKDGKDPDSFSIEERIIAYYCTQDLMAIHDKLGIPKPREEGEMLDPMIQVFRFRSYSGRDYTIFGSSVNADTIEDLLCAPEDIVDSEAENCCEASYQEGIQNGLLFYFAEFEKQTKPKKPKLPEIPEKKYSELDMKANTDYMMQQYVLPLIEAARRR